MPDEIPETTLPQNLQRIEDHIARSKEHVAESVNAELLDLLIECQHWLGVKHRTECKYATYTELMDAIENAISRAKGAK